MIADSRPALAQKSIVSYAFPSNLRLWTATSRGLFKIDKGGTDIQTFLVSLNQIQSSKLKDRIKISGGKKEPRVPFCYFSFLEFSGDLIYVEFFTLNG